jgi:hypothetical protein
MPGGVGLRKGVGYFFRMEDPLQEMVGPDGFSHSFNVAEIDSQSNNHVLASTRNLIFTKVIP